MTRKQIGEFIRVQRVAQNLTQKELAEKVGCRRQVLVEVENDQCDSGMSVFTNLLAGLGFVLMPTISSEQLPKLNPCSMLNFAKIEPARPEDDPRLQEHKRKRIIAQSKKSI